MSKIMSIFMSIG